MGGVFGYVYHDVNDNFEDGEEGFFSASLNDWHDTPNYYLVMSEGRCLKLEKIEEVR